MGSWIIAAATPAAAILETGLFVPTAAPNSRSGNKNGTCGGLARTRKGGKLAMLMNNMPVLGTRLTTVPSYTTSWEAAQQPSLASS